MRLERTTAECAAALESYLERRSPVVSPRSLPVDATGLRDCLVSYVQALRGLGYAPEGALKMTKALILSVTGRNEELRALTDAAVTWAIQAYYSPPPSDG